MGFLMECLDTTEICIHDSGTRVASFMYYTTNGNIAGGYQTNGRIILGRDMGWGVCGIQVAGTLHFQDGWYINIASVAGVGNSFGIVHYKTSFLSVWYVRGDETNTTWNFSDERVKKDIQDINNSLEIIVALKPKKYIRLEEKEEIFEYGLIAQDVEKVIPEIVYTECNYIPNIYDYCEYDNENKIITCKRDISELISLDIKIQIIHNNGDGVNCQRCFPINGKHLNNDYITNSAKVVEVIDNYSFKINDDIDIHETSLFIYGTMKHDFKTLDYKSLHAINIQATKDLYKLVQDL
jgi:hypothetical protein